MIDWIINKITQPILKKYLGSIVRHAISWLGGALAVVSIPAIAELGTQILANADSIEKTALTVLTALVAVLLSFVQKKKEN